MWQSKKEKRELCALFKNTRRRFDTDVLATVLVQGDFEETIIGPDPEGKLQHGLTYRFFGYWFDHKTYGRQFRFSSFCENIPLSRKGVIAYLQRCYGVGSKRAELIWEAFGEDSIRMIKDVSLELYSIKGLTAEIIHAAADKLRSLESTESTTIELHDLMDGSGMPKSVRKLLVEHYGTEAAQKIRENPFMLMSYSGVSFALADELYQKLGLPLDAPDRQGWCLWNLINKDRSGSVWLKRSTLKKKFEKAIGAGADFENALRFGEEKLFYAYREEFIAEADAAEAEQRVAAKIDSMLRDNDFSWPDIEQFGRMTEHQRTEIGRTLTKKIAALSGAPGTGKTYSLCQLIDALDLDDVVVCAPTGKAAVRVSQLLADHGIELKAQTIHTTLHCLPSTIGFVFEYNEFNPLPFQYVIVDEASMISLELMDVLLKAIGPDTQLLFVGDPDQLPPVGVGAPLRDLIKVGIPNGHLTEIIRNEGQIVEACHKIRLEKKFIPAFNRMATPEKNLVNLNKYTSIDEVLRWIIGSRSMNDVQMIVAVNDKSEFSLKEINTISREIFNPDQAGEKKPGVGDKVICSKNGTLLLDRPEQGKQEYHFVANGDMGIIRSIGGEGAVIELTDTLVRVPFEAESKLSMEHFSLGYAITCHKSQGNEWPVVVIFLDDYYGAKGICDRHWLYTAISRAKRECYLIGDMQTAYDMIKQSAMWKRKTFLVEEITEHQWNDFTLAWESDVKQMELVHAE